MTRATILAGAAALACLGGGACSEQADRHLLLPPEVASPPQSGSGVPREIQIGHAVSGTITSHDVTCRFMIGDEVWDGLCNRFQVTAPASGILSVTVNWSNAVPLALFLKTRTGEQVDMRCCDNSPVMVGEVPVDSGATYRLELAYVGRPVGYPQIMPVPFSIEATLLPFDARTSHFRQSCMAIPSARNASLTYGSRSSRGRWLAPWLGFTNQRGGTKSMGCPAVTFAPR